MTAGTNQATRPPSPLEPICTGDADDSPPRRNRSGTILAEKCEARWAHRMSSLDPMEAAWADDASSAGDGCGDGSASGSDSAYGTWDEEAPREGARGALRRRQAVKGRALRHTRSRSVGDAGFLPGASTTSLEEFDLDSSAPDTDDAQDASDYPSYLSTPSSLSEASSRRSTPDPSECEFDVRSSGCPNPLHSGTLRLAVSLKVSTARPLGRRHTLPRRKRAREPSISFSIDSTPLNPATTPPATSKKSPPHATLLLPLLPPLTFLIAFFSLSASLASLVLPYPLLPSSPVHLLHPGSHAAIEYVNAALSPLLIPLSTSGIALAFANLVSLRALEGEAGPGRAVERAGLAGATWAAIISVRVLFAWVFGRVLGWAHPSWFSNAAIHEVGAGLAPLLLALYIIRAICRPTSDTTPLVLQTALLAANFATPVDQGGAGRWWGMSAIVVGVAACVAHFALHEARGLFTAMLSKGEKDGSGDNRRRAHSSKRLAPVIFLLLLLPFLSPPSTAPSPTEISAAFTTLHPSQPHLLTILLMTAPRPGDPDFLIQTIDSWLGALPSPPGSPAPLAHFTAPISNFSTPPPDLASRIRLIVYTHFLTHSVFDHAQTHFSSPFSSAYAAKAAHYITWQRDPRATSDRLDQRLHVARGLAHAGEGGESAYVLLTEDDFPLCPDNTRAGETPSWAGTWDELKRVVVATNVAMPDVAVADSGPQLGHCGIFIATGGSGLLLRGRIAALLPSILLSASDPTGTAREALAALGSFAVSTSDEGADTPDLVIQDCLRGRGPGCEVCAPRLGRGGAAGDRYGKSGLVGTQRLVQHHLGFEASTLPGRRYGKEEWACGWRQPFNGEPDVLTI